MCLNFMCVVSCCKLFVICCVATSSVRLRVVVCWAASDIGALLLGVFFFLCVELEVVCCTLGCIRYRGLRQIVEPCWSQVAPALLIALHKCFDAQPDPGDVSPAGVGVQMQEVEEVRYVLSFTYE